MKAPHSLLLQNTNRAVQSYGSKERKHLMSFFEFQRQSTSFVGVDFSTKRWKCISQGFEKWRNSTKSVPSTIPRHIHQIWLGKKLPKRFYGMCKSWQEQHPGWTYTLWGNEAYDLLDSRMRKNLTSIKNYGLASDILRYHILLSYGGIYADCDFWCIRNFGELIGEVDLLLSSDLAKEGGVLNSLIASQPQHPILAHILNNIHIPQKIESVFSVFESTGPKKLTESFFYIATQAKYRALRNVVLPVQFFFPISNTEIRTVSTRNLHSYVTKDTFAIHLWDMSWVDSEKNLVTRLWRRFRRTVSMRRVICAPWNAGKRVLRTLLKI